MSAQRIIAEQPPGEVSNPTRQFSPTRGVAIDLTLPASQYPFGVRWQGEIHAAEGVRRAQLEAYVGSGATWARSTHSMAADGWEWCEGALLFEPSSPRRIQLRCRSYDDLADARLRNCRIDAVELRPGDGHAWSFELFTGVGIVGEEIAPGQTVEVARVDVPASLGAGPYLLIPSVEVYPNALEPALVATVQHDCQFSAFGIESAGVIGRYPSRAPAMQRQASTLVPGLPITLSVTAGADYTALYRRASIFLINMVSFLPE